MLNGTKQEESYKSDSVRNEWNELMVGGEAGAEAILPLAEFYTELNSMLDRKLKAINQNVNAFIEVHNYIDGDEVASRTTEKVSDNLAIATKKRR